MSVITQPPRPVRQLVLVADDEGTILNLVARVLAQLGLVALSVSDGAAAVQAVVVHQTELVCAMLDVRMPIMNGADAAHAIQKIAPDLPIVLMSGAIPTHYTDRISRLNLAGVLEKPFTLAVLRAMILQALGDGVTLEPDGAKTGQAQAHSTLVEQGTSTE
jgi:two-component system, cell cycle response regulator CpdR